MKKVIFMLFCFSLGTAAMAQTSAIKEEKKKVEMNDLRKDIKTKRHERKEMGKDITHAKIGEAVEERKDVRSEKKHINKDAKRLKGQGVKHPVSKAKRQIHEQKERKSSGT